MPGARETTTFLGQLPATERAELERLGTRRAYERGVVVFHQGDDPGGVLVLLSGRAKVVALGANGTPVLLGLPGPGDLLGEIAAIAEIPRSATVTAIDAIEALALTRQEFERFLEGHPRAAMAVLRALIPRLREADRQRLDFAAHDVTGRVAGRLLDLADRFGEAVQDGSRISLGLSQEELASWTGASREAVAKALRALREAGWVRTERRRITVLDADALRRISN